MLHELTMKWNTIKKTNYRVYLVFIFLKSQIHPDVLWKKLFDFKDLYLNNSSYLHNAYYSNKLYNLDNSYHKVSF